MYTKADLIHDLKDMGLELTDALMVHSKKIFEVCGKLFSIEENCVIDREEIPESWWK